MHFYPLLKLSTHHNSQGVWHQGEIWWTVQNSSRNQTAAKSLTLWHMKIILRTLIYCFTCTFNKIKAINILLIKLHAHEDVWLIGVEAAGLGLESSKHAATLRKEKLGFWMDLWAIFCRMMMGK